MTITTEVIEAIFSIALFINALLFIPQTWRIYRKKTAQGVSLITFSGFLAIQIAISLHGFMMKDYLLVGGCLLSIATCSSVIVLGLIYKKREQNIDQIEITAEEILENLPGHIYWKNKDGVCLGCNTNNWRDIGLKSPTDFIGKTDYDFLPKEEADQITMIDQEVIRTAQLKVTEELATINGKKTTYLSHKIPLKDKCNQVIGILGTSINITQAKQEIVDKLEMLENIIAMMPGNVYWLNKNKIYLGCNDNQAKAVGLISRQEIVGKKNVDIPGIIAPEVVDKVNKEVMEEGKTLLIEESAILEDGEKAVFLSNKVPLFNNRGEVSGMVGISFDITDRKKAEQGAVNEARLKFVSAASHEVRGPIGNVISMAAMLQENLDTLEDITPTDYSKKSTFIKPETLLNLVRKSSEYCTDITHEAEYAMTALKNLGDLHLMELNGVSTQLTLTNLQQFLDIAISKSTQLNPNHIQIKKIIQPELPESIVIDVRNMMAALGIVIGNAVRFSPPQSKIILEVNDAATEKKQLVISVQDFGIGMHQNQIKNVLAISAEIKNKKEAIYSKPSVQLSRVKMYMEASGGALDIQSLAGKGTLIRLIAPYQLLEPELKSNGAPILLDMTPEARARFLMYTPDSVIGTVLLIEDDLKTQEITAQKLTRLGYRVDISQNGVDAIRMATEKEYDIAILDITLPDISGLEVMRQIQELKEDNIIFIALSSHASSEDEEYFLTHGAMMVLAKPIDSKHLKDAMDQALETRARLNLGQE